MKNVKHVYKMLLMYIKMYNVYQKRSHETQILIKMLTMYFKKICIKHVADVYKKFRHKNIYFTKL